ncbi:MAG TPA: PAS domain-containing protein, partial [Candidatus Saccharimonadales bacterium]|nr:PAS domain-containing protein [Candidatus Saccharimonadales bacterium]
MASNEPKFHHTAAAPRAPSFALDFDQVCDSLPDGLIAVDSDGRVRYCNQAVLQLLGLAQTIDGQRLRQVVQALQPEGEDAAGEPADIDRALASALGGDTTRLLIRADRDGMATIVEAICAPYREANAITGMAVSLRDQTPVHEDQQKLRIIQESQSIGLIILDSHGVVEDVKSLPAELNQALLGHSLVEALGGSPLSEQLLLDMDPADIIKWAQRGREITFYAEASFGERLQHLQLVAARMKRPDGEVGIIITSRDVTPLVQKTIEANQMARLASRHSRELTSLAELSGFVGFRFTQIYQKYLETTCSLLDSSHASIYLYQPDVQHLKRVATTAEFNEHEPVVRVGADDPIAAAYVRRKPHNAKKTDTDTPHNVLAVPITYHSKTIGVLVASHRERPYDNHDIKLMRLVSTRLAVIIENAELYNEVNARRERWEAVFRFAEEGIIIFDKAGRVVGFNPAASKLTGVGDHEAMGRPFTEVVAAVSAEGVNLASLSPIRRVLSDGEVVTKRQQLLQNKNGRTLWTEISYSPIY